MNVNFQAILKNPEIRSAIESGYVFDDSGNDVRKTNELAQYDHDFNEYDEPSLIYRLWNGDPDKCTEGVRIEISDSRTKRQTIDPADGSITGN